MRSRLEMIKEVGFGRGAALAGVSLAMYAAVSLAIVAADQPAQTGQALMEFVSPSARAAENSLTENKKPEVMPSSAQAKTWDKVTYGEHDFDPQPGQIQD
jgi:hypothetical protein